MSFSDVKDQPVPMRLLRNIVRSGRVPHGLLLWGPGGVGKSLAALEFAKALNCEAGEADACGSCLTCRKTANGNHPDVKTVTPSGKARLIKIEAIDFINELAAYRPFEGRWRVVIIHDTERMHEAAQNHFLKTLEEPPSDTVFVLLTEFPRALLPTVRSRCQQLRFGALRPETVTALLMRERELPEARAAAVAAVSQGQMSRALDFVDTGKREAVLDITGRLASREDPLALSEEFVRHIKTQQEVIKETVKAATGDEAIGELSREDQEEQENAQIALAESLVRRDLMEYLYLFQVWYRDALVFQATRETDGLLNKDQAARLALEPPAKGAHLAAIEKAWLYIERNLNMERVFRDLFFALAP